MESVRRKIIFILWRNYSEQAGKKGHTSEQEQMQKLYELEHRGTLRGSINDFYPNWREIYSISFAINLHLHINFFSLLF